MNNLLDVLDIQDEEDEPINAEVEVISTETTALVNGEDVRSEIDLETARRNLNYAAKLGNEVLGKAAENAKAAADPEFYESFASVLKQITEVNGKLVEIHTGKPNRQQPKTFNQQNIVVTTTELQKLLKDMRNGNTTTQS